MTAQSAQQTRLLRLKRQQSSRLQGEEIILKSIIKNCESKEDSDVEMEDVCKPRRKIGWNGTVAVREIMHLSSYTTEEFENSWYKREDFISIKASMARLVQRMVANQPLGEEEAYRGLEYRHRAGSIKRKQNKLHALIAVLEEQDRQWHMGYENDEELAACYCETNFHCRKPAHVLGLQDQEEAFKIYRNDETTRELLGGGGMGIQNENERLHQFLNELKR